jgi:hypothetical protein
VHSGETALAELGRFIDGKMDGAVALARVIKRETDQVFRSASLIRC